MIIAECAQAVGMIRAIRQVARLSIGDISIFRVSGWNTYIPEVLKISGDSPKEEWRLPYRTFKLAMTVFRIVLPWQRRRHVIQWADTAAQSIHSAQSSEGCWLAAPSSLAGSDSYRKTHTGNIIVDQATYKGGLGQRFICWRKRHYTTRKWHTCSRISPSR